MPRQSRMTHAITPRRTDSPDVDALARALFVAAADSHPGGRRAFGALVIRINKMAAGTYTPRPGDALEAVERGMAPAPLAQFFRDLADALERVAVEPPVPTFGALAREIGEALAAGAEAVTAPCAAVDAVALRELGEAEVAIKTFRRSIGARRFQRAAPTRTTPLGRVEVVR